MRIAFAGFNYMDGKGEENNEIVFLKRILDELANRNISATYIHQGSVLGINNIELFDYMGLKADRFNLNQYTDFPLNEFEKYSREELKYSSNGHIPMDKTNTEKIDIERKYLKDTVKGIENLSIYHSQNPIDIFVVCGNYFISNVVKVYCRKNKIKYFVLENGYFRPYTLMIDNYGVNYECSIPKDIHFYSNIEVNQEEFDEYLLKPKQAFEDREYTLNAREKFYKYNQIDLKKIFLNKIDSNIKENQSNEILLKKEFEKIDFIYVPFQLESDSQITKHSPYIKKMKELVHITANALKNYNETNKKNVKLVYKCHPLYQSELKNLELDYIEDFCSNNNNLILLKSGDNEWLLENSKLVITINSTVGFEALLKKKHVITLGDAFYAIDGITKTWEPHKSLEVMIQDSLLHGPDLQKIRNFLYYLRFEYFFEIFWKNPDKNSIRKLIDKIIE